MDITSDYDALSRRRRQQDAATVSSNIQSSDENPDEVADNINFAREYAQVTGNPAPSPQMVKEFRGVLQQRMDEARNTVMLSTARRTATWYGENPMAVLLAKDDVPNLCSFEQKVQRFWEAPKSNPQTAARVEESIAPVSPPAAPPQPQGPVAPTAQSRALPIAPAAPTSAPAAEDANTSSPPAVPSTQPPVSPTQPVPQPTEPAPQTAQPAAPTTGNLPPSAEPTIFAASDAPLAPEEPLSDDDKNKEALIEEIRNAKNAPSENIPILQQKIQDQNWFDKIDALDTLYGVLHGTATDADVRAQLGSRYAHRLTAAETWERAKSIGQNSLELLKATPGGSVSLTGYMLEGEGQLQNSYPTPKQRAFLDQMPKAINLSDDEFASFEQDIYRQNLIDPMEAHMTLLALRAGDTTPEKVRKSFENPFPEFSKNLETWGQQLQDYGDSLFPAAPGYENSVGRKIGKGIGMGAPLAVAGYLGGPVTVAILASLQAAGEGAADARKRGLTEEQQSLAAQRYFWTGPIAALPIAKYLSPALKWVPAGRIIQGFLSGAIDESLKQGSQKGIRNEMDRQLYDPGRKWSDGVAETMLIAAVVGSVNHGIEKGLAFLGGHGDSHASAQQTEAAIHTREVIDDISTAAQTSKLFNRSPDTFHSFVAKMTPNPQARDVFVPAGAFVRAAEAASINPHDLVDSRVLALARATGGDVKLSMATYATYFAGSKGDGFIMDNVRPHADSLTFAEAQAFREHADAYRGILNPKGNPAFSSPTIDRAAEQRIYNLAVLRSAIAEQPAETVSHFTIRHSAFSSALARSEGRSLDEYLKLYPQP